jgi:hypothetical protein
MKRLRSFDDARPRAAVPQYPRTFLLSLPVLPCNGAAGDRLRVVVSSEAIVRLIAVDVNPTAPRMDGGFGAGERVSTTTVAPTRLLRTIRKARNP